MIAVRRTRDRGYADHGWLESYHTFSFAGYHDPRHMGYSVLRVLNDDRVAPGAGFAEHGHRDMEIISYVLEGALEHRDSIGHGSVLRPNEVQRLSAGTGLRHSEYNASQTEPVHFLQIWILPHHNGLAPGYEQKRFDSVELNGRLRLIASPDGREDSLTIQQDAFVFAARLENAGVIRPLTPGRKAYVHIARGAASVNGEALSAGDGAKVEHETVIALSTGRSAEVLLFDMPG